MLSLKLPEDLHNWVLTYWMKVAKSKFVINDDGIEHLNPPLVEELQRFQLKDILYRMNFIDSTNLKQMHFIASKI